MASGAKTQHKVENSDLGVSFSDLVSDQLKSFKQNDVDDEFNRYSIGSALVTLDHNKNNKRFPLFGRDNQKENFMCAAARFRTEQENFNVYQKQDSFNYQNLPK